MGIMNPINKVYGDFIIQNLNGFEIIICGTLTFKERSKDIAELRWRMDRFKEERLVKYRITSSCYWVVEKMSNNNNHIHLMIGIRKDNYKEVDDYCKIFGKYWENVGSCRFEGYDSEKGLFQDYMFKDFNEWEFFETEFGDLRNNVLFSQNKKNISMTKIEFNLLDFVDLIETKVKISTQKNVKDSVIDYINKELKEIEDNHNELDLVLKLTKGGKIKEIRCWGDVKFGERKFRLMCKNEKVYTSYELAEKGESFKLRDNSKQCVIDTLNGIKKVCESMNSDDIKLWYRKKIKGTKEVEILSIHDKK
jgi:hypothetical protein